MPTSDEQKFLKKIKTEADAVKKSLDHLYNELKGSGGVYPATKEKYDEGRKNIAAIQDDVSALLSAGGASGSTGSTAADDQEQITTIKRFFEEVADGVVGAQQNLDEQSRIYMKELSPLALPSIFRLPKATAEFQFGISSSSSSGFDVFIASRTAEEQEKMQQKISFEIISAPPPPDYVVDTKSTPINFPYVGSRYERGVIHEKIRDLLKKMDLSAPKKALLDEIRKAANWRKVLVFLDQERWILIHSMKQNDALTTRIDYLIGNGADIVLGGNVGPKALADFFANLSKEQADTIMAQDKLLREGQRAEGS